MGTAGSGGELSSATDTSAVVQHSGTAGDCALLFAQGFGKTVVNITGTGAVAQPVLDPSFKAIFLTKDAGVTSVTNFGQLADGFQENHKVVIANTTGITNTLTLDGTTSGKSVTNNTAVEVTWSGTAWIVTGGYTLASVGTVIGGGTASNVGATVIGSGTASAFNAIAIGGGVASGTGAKTFGGGTASGQDARSFGGTASGQAAIAFAGTAAGTSSVAIAGATVRYYQGLGKILNNMNASTRKGHNAEILLCRNLFEEDESVLTLDGGNPGSTNMLKAADFTGDMMIHFFITCFDTTNDDGGWHLFERFVGVHSTGTVMTVKVVDGTDRDSGGFSTHPSVAISVSSNTLAITVTCPAEYAVDCVAEGRVSGVYV